MSQITALARKYAPWSISKAGVAEICPRQFQHKYLLKSSATFVPSANTVGTAAHAVLEHRAGGKSAGEAMKIALEKTPLTSNERESLRVLEEPMDWFMRKWEDFCRRFDVVEVLREVEWGLTDEMKPTGFFAADVFFRGKVDLGARTASGELVVIDHKSGLAKNVSRDMKLKRQLNSYGVLAAANLEGFRGMRAAIHFLQGEEADRIQWLDYVDADEIRRTQVPWLLNYLSYCAAKLVEPFPALPGLRFPCPYCSYQTECKEYQEALAVVRGA